MVACEAKEHGHDSKQRHQVEGPITCGAHGYQSHKGKIITLEKTEPGRGTKPPRLVGLGRPASPIKAPPGALLWQASNSSISLFVCSKF
jgi:hypothetical protein